MKEKISLAFLWHMHQPLYKDFLTGEYLLPWVRLHATYSYLDMISMIERFPGIKGTFNFSSCLLWQLKDISSAKTIKDKYLALSLKNAKELSEEDKLFILKTFFSCHIKGDLGFHERYKDLRYRRGDNSEDEALLRRLKDFSEQEIRDIQVYFNLAWCGYTMRREEPLCGELIKKGSDYTEQDKKRLLDLQLKVVGRIIPLYKKAWEKGTIEITATPYYHPILPLLASSDKRSGFLSDADEQVKRAVLFHKSVFGKKPFGMWPAEGAVSPEAVSIFSANGMKWIASCEGVLRESLKDKFSQDDTGRVYRVGSGSRQLDMIFRDEALSNAMSFNYAGMSPEKASEKFMETIKRYNREREDPSSKLVSVILDGENPWPYYPKGGEDFLCQLYGDILSSPEVETVRVSEYLQRGVERQTIKSLHSGSWIARNFSKWSGSDEKDRAWDELCKAKSVALDSGIRSESLKEEILIAEGSDWFWWYDDFGGHMDLVFDDIFRDRKSVV